MAQSYTGPDGTQVVPGATVRAKANNTAGGVLTDGVVLIMGEAEEGPSFSEESDLDSNRFGPSQLAEVVAKYGSGRIVDAFIAATAPLNDDEIVGAPSSILVVKTNTGTKASGVLSAYPSGTYGTLSATKAGQVGNLVQFSVDQAQAEILPTTGLFTWILNAGTVQIGARLNGGTQLATGVLAALRTPTQIVSDINGALTGITAAGGAVRTVVATGGPTLAVGSLSGATAVLTYSTNWITTPSVGDTIYIPVGSVIAGAGNANTGSYVVTAATTTTVSVTKLRNATVGALVNPVAVGAAAVSGTPANDIQVYAPISISVSTGVPVNGIGKSLEILELTGGTDLLSNCAYALGSTAVTWVSKTGASQVLTSSAEYRATLNASRSIDQIVESVTAGGEIGMTVSYQGTSATITVSATGITSTVAGGSGAVLPTINFSQFATISDVATYINTQTGWKAAVGTASAGQLPSTSLDRGTFNCATEFGARTCRIKTDASRMFDAMDQLSLVQLGDPEARVAAGVPAPTAISFLTNGTKGATLAANITSAFSAIENVQCNFVVPLFSQSATADISASLTDAASTYDISTIHSALRSHLIKMELRTQAKNRQGFPSIRTTFAAAKEAAANFANFRAVMSFEDIRNPNQFGVTTTFQPWMAGVLAAAGQAAAGYQGLVLRKVNITSAFANAADWNDQNYDAKKEALESGLMPIVRHPKGGWMFLSDQTTYLRDRNFVYNSLQAVYTMDRISLNLRQDVEDEFGGDSAADVTAGAVVTFCIARLAEYRRRKWITKSDGTPSGFKNLTVKMNGPAIEVNVEVILAGLIYFIPISISVSQSVQVATAQ